MALPENVAKLFRDKNFGVLTTRRKDGTPHPTSVWIDTDGETVSFNTNTERAKYKHLQDDPWAAITVMPTDDPQSGFVTVYGKAVEFDTEGGGAHIDKMAQKYIGEEKYPWLAPGEQRVIVKIKPERYDGYGVGEVKD